MGGNAERMKRALRQLGVEPEVKGLWVEAQAGEIDGDECVPKWDLLQVSEVHEVKCTLAGEVVVESICCGSGGGGGVCRCATGWWP